MPPAEPITLMKLGNADVQAPPLAADDDLTRFILDVASAWNGELALTPPDEDASTDLPSYTLLSPARPETPVPTSPDSAGDLPRNRVRSMSSSKSSSYGRPQPSTLFMSAVPESPSVAEFAALGTAHGQRAFATAPSPDDVDDAEKDLPPVPPPPSSPLDTVQDFIRLWNERYFHPRELEAFVVPQVGPEGAAEFAVNLVARPGVRRDMTPRSDDTKNSADPGASGSS
ncbi:hypothetical protein C8R46DRAFT_116099 [Mycena filopes]|nr:hypothetical protein C8R46DRAFT_116099 [Mycena filopes]